MLPDSLPNPKQDSVSSVCVVVMLMRNNGTNAQKKFCQPSCTRCQDTRSVERWESEGPPERITGATTRIIDNFAAGRVWVARCWGRIDGLDAVTFGDARHICFGVFWSRQTIDREPGLERFTETRCSISSTGPTRRVIAFFSNGSNSSPRHKASRRDCSAGTTRLRVESARGG